MPAAVQRTLTAGRVEYVLPPAVFLFLKELSFKGDKTQKEHLTAICQLSPGPCFCGHHMLQAAGCKVMTVEVKTCTKCGVLTVESDLNSDGVCATCLPANPLPQISSSDGPKEGSPLPSSPPTTG
jgi:hypothetical protein